LIEQDHRFVGFNIRKFDAFFLNTFLGIKIPEEKKQAIKNDVIQSLRSTFPSGGPVKFTGELILGTRAKPHQ
jgi:hypothetical protein